MPDIKVTWVNVREKKYAIARWVATGKLIVVITDYSLYIAQERADSPLTVETAIYHIVPLIRFLAGLNIDLENIDDGILRRFRDEEFTRLKLKRKNNARVSDKVYKRTVNARLRRIYSFLFWYQTISVGVDHLIGFSGCNVKSSITDSTHYGKRGLYKHLFPLLYSRTGSGSKHRPIFCATEKDKQLLIKHFSESQDDYLAARNIMILEIADTIGLRRSSINSLSCQKFISSLDDNEGFEDLEITPSSQKFNYQYTFTFPFWLVGSVVEYIEGPRAALFKKIGVPISTGKDRLFVSSKTGRPLTNRSITDLMSSALRAVGANYGSIHGFRHKFVNDEIEREISFRVQNKMDTSMDSIAATVSVKVGHANPASLYTYISRTLQQMAKYLPEDDLSKIESMEKEISLLSKELRALKGFVE